MIFASYAILNGDSKEYKGNCKMKKILLVVASALATSAWAEVTYTFEDDGRTYVATVEDGQETALSEAAAAVLNGDTVTKFVKRGNGLLRSARDISSFTGDIDIEDGVFQSSPLTASALNVTVGNPEQGTVYVRDGATFDISTDVKSHYLKKTFHFCGQGHEDGVNGKWGALHVSSSGQAEGAMQGLTALDGDVMMRLGCARNVAVICGPMDMGGHTLTFKSDFVSQTASGTYGPIVQCQSNASVGDVVVDGAVNITAYLKWLVPATIGGKNFTVNRDSVLILNSMAQSNVGYAQYRLVMSPGARIQLNGQREKHWQGPVVLEDPGKNAITCIGSTPYSIEFNGDISGGGLIVGENVDVTVNPGNNNRNTSTNGFTVLENGRLILRPEYRSANKDGGDIVISNGFFVCASEGSDYTLPGVRFAGTSTMTGRFAYNYDSPSKVSSDASRRNCIRLPALTLDDGPSVAFSTNVVTDRLVGLGSVSNRIDSSRVEEKYAGTHCAALKVISTWTFDAADVVKGHALLTDGRLDFGSGMVVRLTGSGVRPALGRSKSFVVARADGGVNWLGSKTLEVEEPERWKLELGSDGKTVVATYLPRGLSLIVR